MFLFTERKSSLYQRLELIHFTTGRYTEATLSPSFSDDRPCHDARIQRLYLFPSIYISGQSSTRPAVAATLLSFV